MSKQKKYKSNFQDLRLQSETFKTWLQKKPGNPYKARCKVCAKDIAVGLHGITALFSHADGTKHKEGYQRILQFHSLNVLNFRQVLRPY